MTKGQLIDGIRQLNTTATIEFLAQFNEINLRRYLDHLINAHHRGVRICGWVRRRRPLRKVS